MDVDVARDTLLRGYERQRGSVEKNDKCPEDKRIREYRDLSLRWDHDLS